MSTVALPTPAIGARDVVRELMQLIQEGGFAVGDRLPPIRDLARKFDSSTTAVRDALMEVQALGVIKVLPRSGAFVQSCTYAPLVNAFAGAVDGALLQADSNLFHLLEARQLIEVECAIQAARRRRLEDLLPVREALEQMDAAFELMHTDRSEQGREQFVEADVRFHLAIAHVAGNPVLETVLRSLLASIRPHLAQIPWARDRREITREAHLDLYNALLDGDAEQAGLEMRQHLKLAYDGLLKKIWSVPRAHSSLSPGESSPDEDGNLPKQSS